MKLKRYENNPIVSPNPAHTWESLVTTNPAAWYDEESGEVKLLYRCAGNDAEHRVHLALAVSKDGYNFERVGEVPVVSPLAGTMDAGCLEDPRLVKFGEWYHITAAVRPFPPGKYWESDAEKEYHAPFMSADTPVAYQHCKTSTVLILTKDFKTFIRAGRMTDPSLDDRDVIIFPEKINGKYYTLHRPYEWCGDGYETEFPAMWIAESDDLLGWKDMKFFAKGKHDWEQKIGGSTPPIRTDKGWLTLYHAVGDDKHYRIGAFLLDLDDPTRILHRTTDFIYEPEVDYELKGLYNGVVFPCGNVVIDGTLFVYYGGADKYCGVATCALSELVDYVASCPA